MCTNISEEFITSNATPFWELIQDCVRFDIFTWVIMKNAVFWDIMPHGSGKN
jgi:hypothetical protein